jgi:histidine triad (HIT) family protein
MNYDPDNIFAKIINGTIPVEPVLENEHVIVIKDKFPQAPVHLLVLPKKPYINMTDFTQNASDEEIVALNRVTGQIITRFDLTKNGYRIISNAGNHGGQEIPHLHWHILGGKSLGKMLSTD